MRVLSNVEFERLTAKQAYRLQAISKRRAERDPEGSLMIDEIPEYIKACTYSGDHKSATWLKSLVALAQSGKIDRMRQGAETFEEHQSYVRTLRANGSIKFDLNDSVQCKESGRYGQVVDYLPETKEYVVILDPFQVKTYKESQITKVG
jgi:hypothetical protein